MSYCIQHAIHIVSTEKKKLSDYVVLYEILAEKINNDFNPNYFPFVFNPNVPCITDANWNYGYGSDWSDFEKDMLKLSKEADAELTCVWQGEETQDNGFLHIKMGEVVEKKKLTEENRKWFNSIYYMGVLKPTTLVMV